MLRLGRAVRRVVRRQPVLEMAKPIHEAGALVGDLTFAFLHLLVELLETITDADYLAISLAIASVSKTLLLVSMLLPRLAEYPHRLSLKPIRQVAVRRISGEDDDDTRPSSCEFNTIVGDLASGPRDQRTL
jgi:hypothetical protein